MYYINERLVRSVSQLFGMTRREFSVFAMDSAQLYAQRMTLWSRLSVNDIIKIANATHIPMRHFFVQDEKGYVPRKKEEITFKGEWQEVSMNIPFIEYVYKHEELYNRYKIKECMGVTGAAFYNWYRDGSCNMKAQQACDFCNCFGCDMKNLINDPNDLLPGVTEQGKTAPEVEDKDMPPIEQRQQELENLVKSLSKQMDIFYQELQVAKEEAAVANAKLRSASTKRPTLSYVCETEDEYSPYRWQASKWSGENVPTLKELVKHCNSCGENILRYLTRSHYPTPANSRTTLSEKRLATLLRLANKDYKADDFLVSQFCSLLNECKLTPASVIDADYIQPSFTDRLLHTVADM